MLHRLHPLAGQGFNMSIRDTKEILEIIKKRLDNGLELDKSVLIDFEKKVRHKNYLFSNGIDFIYEFFKLESKISSNILSKSIQLFGKNKIANNFFTNSADNGII
jgi:2-octaprenyl-6-methoxyphenol hydroxylase